MKARKEGTARTVQHMPCVEYRPNGRLWIIMCHNRGSAIHDQETWSQNPLQEKVGSSVSGHSMVQAEIE